MLALILLGGGEGKLNFLNNKVFAWTTSPGTTSTTLSANPIATLPPSPSPSPSPPPSQAPCSYLSGSCTRVNCPSNKECAIYVNLLSGNVSCVCCVPKNGDCNNSSNNCCPNLDCIAGKCKPPPCTSDADCTNPSSKPHCCISQGSTTGICGECCEDEHCSQPCEECIKSEYRGNQYFCYPKSTRDLTRNSCSPKFSCPDGEKCDTTSGTRFGYCFCVEAF